MTKPGEKKPVGSRPGAIYFEFIPIGNAMKVCAIDPVTGTEVAIVGPVGAARHDLERLAVAKLRRVISSKS